MYDHGKSWTIACGDFKSPFGLNLISTQSLFWTFYLLRNHAVTGCLVNFILRVLRRLSSQNHLISNLPS